MKKLSALILCAILTANIIFGTVLAAPAPNESSAEAEKLLIEFFNNKKNELNGSDNDYAFLADIDNDGNPEFLFDNEHIHGMSLSVYKVIDGKVTEMSNSISGGYGTRIHWDINLLLDDDGHMYLYTVMSSGNPWEFGYGTYNSHEISEWTENGEKMLKYIGFSLKINGDEIDYYYSTELDGPTVKITDSEEDIIYSEFENLIKPYIVWTEDSEYQNRLDTDIWEKQKELYKKNSTVFNEQSIILQIGNSCMDVDGETKPIDAEYNVAPIIKDERTLVPVRAIVEEIGGSVEWDAENCAATLSYGEAEIKLVIGENIAYLNGVPRVLDVAPIIENGRTMFPIRFIAENFGFDVKWKKLTNQIIVSGYDNHGNF